MFEKSRQVLKIGDGLFDLKCRPKACLTRGQTILQNVVLGADLDSNFKGRRRPKSTLVQRDDAKEASE